MKKITKAVVSVLLAAAMVGSIGAAYADGDISVRMDSVISDGTDYVNFGDIKPIQIDNRTLIPARDMAESAGMEVTWDQSTQTALLTLTANAYSEKPIERYAADLINQIEDFGLNLMPTSITAALKLNSSNAVIRFNFTDSDGDNVPFGTDYEMVSKAILFNDGTLMVPVRDSMEMFGMNVGWNQDELCAYVSIPDNAVLPEGLKIIANHGEGEYAPTEENLQEYDSYRYEDFINLQNGTDNTDDYGDMQIGSYIGTFKITHYCPCSICNGGWGAHTAWAGELIPGQTIAVNPSIIPPLTWVYVDGYGYRRAEDTGSGIGEYHIDMAVPTHKMAMELGVVYKDVYLAE